MYNVSEEDDSLKEVCVIYSMFENVFVLLADNREFIEVRCYNLKTWKLSRQVFKYERIIYTKGRKWEVFQKKDSDVVVLFDYKINIYLNKELTEVLKIEKTEGV